MAKIRNLFTNQAPWDWLSADSAYPSTHHRNPQTGRRAEENFLIAKLIRTINALHGFHGTLSQLDSERAQIEALFSRIENQHKREAGMKLQFLEAPQTYRAGIDEKEDSKVINAAISYVKAHTRAHGWRPKQRIVSEIERTRRTILHPLGPLSKDRTLSGSTLNEDYGRLKSDSADTIEEKRMRSCEHTSNSSSSRSTSPLAFPKAQQPAVLVRMPRSSGAPMKATCGIDPVEFDLIPDTRSRVTASPEYRAERPLVGLPPARLLALCPDLNQPLLHSTLPTSSLKRARSPSPSLSSTTTTTTTTTTDQILETQSPPAKRPCNDVLDFGDRIDQALLKMDKWADWWLSGEIFNGMDPKLDEKEKQDLAWDSFPFCLEMSDVVENNHVE